ncbi:putative disease resistance protein At1g58400 [Salvia hispanica]|uniref:putative disease resistance protein At1g58400 n=1 Tax=Salvia hispanica TaxID=49212 RepID=UPI0020098FF4|nr:putative disease resistance protein At1g58400 [Salvia hispanica]
MIGSKILMFSGRSRWLTVDHTQPHLSLSLVMSCLARNMSEAIILGSIHKLESVLIEPLNIDSGVEKMLKEVVDELRTTLDFSRENESGERKRLSYLLADFAEIAQYSADLTIHIHDYRIQIDLTAFLSLLPQMRQRVAEFGVEDVHSVGQEEEEAEEEAEEGVVVGLEKDVQLINRAILNENPETLVSCIKGMIGVGKTTLARQVYNHPAIVGKFKHRRAWVSMSRDTSIHEVLVELVKQLVGLDGDLVLLEEMDNRSLRQMICQNMEGMPYFIVFDNMPKEMYLFCIYLDLPLTGTPSVPSYLSQYYNSGYPKLFESLGMLAFISLSLLRVKLSHIGELEISHIGELEKVQAIP